LDLFHSKINRLAEGYVMTNEEMDADVEHAASYLSCCPSMSVDRCRHPSVTETALWFFDNGRQIASAHRLETTSDYRWEVTRLGRGGPVARRATKTVLEAVGWVLKHASNNVNA
jgi:hypothetical protein